MASVCFVVYQKSLWVEHRRLAVAMLDAYCYVLPDVLVFNTCYRKSYRML